MPRWEIFNVSCNHSAGIPVNAFIVNFTVSLIYEQYNNLAEKKPSLLVS